MRVVGATPFTRRSVAFTPLTASLNVTAMFVSEATGVTLARVQGAIATLP